MIRFLALMAVSMAFMASGATAQSWDAYGTPAFEEFLQGDLVNRLRRETLQRSLSLHQPSCVETPTYEVIDTRPVTPIVMPEGAVVPTEGMWQERLSGSACEEPFVENLVHTFTENGQRTFLLARGRTEATLETQLTLINDTRDVAAGHDNARGCDIIRFTDSMVANRYGATRWMERWTADACGGTIRLEVLFDADDSGRQTYTIRMAN